MQLMKSFYKVWTFHDINSSIGLGFLNPKLILCERTRTWAFLVAQSCTLLCCWAGGKLLWAYSHLGILSCAKLRYTKLLLPRPTVGLIDHYSYIYLQVNFNLLYTSHDTRAQMTSQILKISYVFFQFRNVRGQRTVTAAHADTFHRRHDGGVTWTAAQKMEQATQKEKEKTKIAQRFFAVANTWTDDVIRLES